MRLFCNIKGAFISLVGVTAVVVPAPPKAVFGCMIGAHPVVSQRSWINDYGYDYLCNQLLCSRIILHT